MFSKLFFLLAMFVGNQLEASSPTFTLIDNASGNRYQCDQNGNGGIDPNCTETIARYCASNTSFGRDACFTRSSQACSNANANGGFANCVISAADYCRNNTSFGRDACFTRGIDSCGGNFAAIRELFEGVNK